MQDSEGTRRRINGDEDVNGGEKAEGRRTIDEEKWVRRSGVRSEGVVRAPDLNERSSSGWVGGWSGQGTQ